VNFLADESVDQQIVDRLRQNGHSVAYVAEMDPGISNNAVIDLANRERAVLLTADKDFGELVFRQGRLPPGVVLIRLAGLPTTMKADIVASEVNAHATELSAAFAVIAPNVFRIRRQST